MKTCLECNQPAAPNRARCSEHLADARRRMRDFYQGRKEAGLCTDCGEPADSGVYCSGCAEHRRQLSRDRRIRYYEQGLCRHCGKPKSDKRTHCERCLAKFRRRYHERRLKSPRHQAKTRDDFRCRICDKETKLIVHHIDGQGEVNPDTRKRQKPNNEPGNLITLCASCHAALTCFLNRPNTELVISLLRREPV